MPAPENATPEDISLIAWGDFKVAMLSDLAYQRVSEATAAQRAVSRIETYFAAEVENWPVAAMFWGQMVRACPTEQAPTEAEATAWNQIAAAMNMPIEFTSNGYLNPKTEE
ncbi:MAG: hypothetical protein AAFQ63_09060 [Cyanobacteria bacterium J06621_11]